MVKFLKGLIKLLITLILVIALLGGTIYVYCTYFVSKPENTVEKMLGAIENMNISEVLECLDPQVERQYGAMLGITGGLFSSFTGIDISLLDVLTIAPTLMYGDSIENDMDVEDMGVVFYADCSGEELQEKIDKMSETEIQSLTGQYISDVEIMYTLSKKRLWFPSIGNLVAKSCVMRVLLEGENEYEYFVLEKYADLGWRVYIPL